MRSFSLLFWLPGLLYTDDIFCGFNVLGFQLEGVSAATRRAPHKCLAATFGLDQPMYAFTIYSPIHPIHTHITDAFGATCRGLCRRNWLGVYLFCKSYYRPPSPARAYQTVLRPGFRRGRLRPYRGRTKK